MNDSSKTADHDPGDPVINGIPALIDILENEWEDRVIDPARVI